MCFAPHRRDLPPDWRAATFTTLREVEDLLDLLEIRGGTEVEMQVLGEKLFTVRWR